jgi:hypothetical protein
LSSQSKVILIAQGWDSALENTVKKQLIRMNERKGKSNNEINAKKRTRYLKPFSLAPMPTLVFSTPGRNRTGTPERTGF